MIVVSWPRANDNNLMFKNGIAPINLFMSFTVMFGDLPRSLEFLVKKWFVSFIDDHTRLCWIYLMNEESEVAIFFFYRFLLYD